MNAPELAYNAVIESRRQARMDASILYPSMCIRHHRKLTWLPAPAWWIHNDSLNGPAHTCSAMWAKYAPEPIEAE